MGKKDAHKFADRCQMKTMIDTRVCNLVNVNMSSSNHELNDTFQLYDLRVEVICPPGKRIMCGAKEGDYFTLEGEMLYLPPGQGISIYSLGASLLLDAYRDMYVTSDIGAVLPLLAAKQRMTAANDWMSTDAEVACPDPCCPSRLRIVRTGIRSFKHGDTTLVPLPRAQGATDEAQHDDRTSTDP